MKILAIRGRNLASLEGEFALDFTTEPLASASIFSISGPTGSGKSTLLDAMCLALFARTPRTEQAKERQVKLKDVNNDQLSQGDPRFLLRRGTASCYAEVDFVALNGHTYRSRWSVSRARDHEDGRLKAAQITLIDLDTNQEEKGNVSVLQTRIVELIGLTFEQFTRSVLLAQNDFSTFLKAEQGEKASLLEKLTGTELYSHISQAIYTKSSEAKNAYEQLNLQTKGVDLLPDEEVQRLQASLKEAQIALTDLEKEKQERQRLEDAVKTVDIQLAAKQKRQTEVSQLLQTANRMLTNCQQQRSEVEEALEKENLKAEVFQQQLREARERDVDVQKAFVSKSEAETHLKEVEVQKKKTEDELLKVEKNENKAKAEQVSLIAWQEKYKNKAAIAEQFPVLNIHLDACLAARSEIKKFDREIEKLSKENRDAETAQNKVLLSLKKHEENQIELEKRRKLIEDALKSFDPQKMEEERVALTEKREALLMEQIRFMASGDIKKLREKLVDNQPCPVCGSLSHPYATHEAELHLLSLNDQIAQATKRLDALKEEKEGFDKQQKELANLQQKESTLLRLKTDDEKLLSDYVNQLKSCVEKIQRENNDKQQQEKRLSESLEAANVLFGNSTWQPNWERDPSAFMKTLTDFVSQWQSTNERLSLLEREMSAFSARRESYTNALTSQREQFEQKNQVCKDKQQCYEEALAKRKELFDGADVNQVEQAFNKKMQDLNRNLQTLQNNVTKQTAEVAQYRGLSEQIESDVKELSDQLEKNKKAVLTWQESYQAKAEGKTLEASINFFTKQQSDAQFQLRTNEDNLKKIENLRVELEKQKVISEQWARLNDLVGSADGGKFRRIAQGYTLDILLNYANVQLKLLTRRYRLERVPDTLALQVIDQDMCDEIRTVHSLSGGESFLVSLALALGLSSLSSNRMKVESLFIDEGFGSLDAETLRVAMDALESLRSQGRKIGVISHVQEMSERIPVQVRVNRAGNGRSYIEVV